MSSPSSASLPAAEERTRRIGIAFVNLAHALDHYVMLIYPTVVIGLVALSGRSYDELLFLATASFFAFGIFSLPAGWIADHWSRRNMMAVFFFGSGLSLVAAGAAPNFTLLALALFALGVFASIYHPVATAMVVAAARHRGRSLALNGVCGNLGVAFAAGITAAITAWVGWRGAFLVPAAICLLAGIAYLAIVPDDRVEGASRSAAPDVRLAARLAAAVFALFVVIGFSAGLVFNVVTIALPKIIDERLGFDISLVAVGSIATAVFLCGAIAQLLIGRVLERAAPHLVFATVALLQFAGLVVVAATSGVALLVALAVTLAALYAQIIVTDFVIARYTADAWRSRIYAVRYFVTYVISGVAAWMIAALYARGGFDLVLATTAAVAFAFVISTILVALLVHGVERGRQAMQPAE
jgi:MFS family permease